MYKKKLLIRIGSLRHGGAEKVLVTFLKNIPKDKYQIDLLLNLKSGKYLKEVPDWVNIFWLTDGDMITTNRPKDIPIKCFRKMYHKILEWFPKLLYKFILKNRKYDIELIANHTLLEEVLRSPFKKAKKIVWIHNDLFKIPEYTTERLRNFFLADKIMVISDVISKGFEALAQNEEEKAKITRIFNPIDSHEILRLSEESVDYNFDKEVKTFVTIGTIFPQKGFDRLLNVHKKLLDEGFSHKIMIIGDGYDWDVIKKQIEKLKLKKTVDMLGFKANPYPYFSKADYYVLPSRYEGYPTVLFEAIILKKSIIATDVSGVREILQNGELGMIVENSEEGIYKGMKDFLTKPELEENYKEIIINRKLPFTLENAVNSLMNVIDK